MQINFCLLASKSLKRSSASGWLLKSTVLALSLSPLVASDYYVSVSGNDSKSGSSAATAWKTISRVNQNQYVPGDRILFQGGEAFPGTLNFRNTSAGTAAMPIVITSYGTSRAIIQGGSGYAFRAYNTAGFVISTSTLPGPA